MARAAFAILTACVALACAPAPENPPASPKQAATPPAQGAIAVPAEPTCVATAIYRDGGLRDGLPEGASECRAALQSVTDSLTRAAPCSADADCVIRPLAGGCMGAGLVREGEPAPLPASCVPDDCASADFTDHEVRCESGCCAVFET